MTNRRKTEEISELTFYPIKPTDKGLVCYVSFTFQNSIRINEVRIYTKPSGGYYLSYPRIILANGKKISSVYPINKKVGNKIEDFLLKAYDKFIKKITKND